MKQKIGPVAIGIAVVVVLLLIAVFYMKFMAEPTYTAADVAKQLSKGPMQTNPKLQNAPPQVQHAR